MYNMYSKVPYVNTAIGRPFVSPKGPDWREPALIERKYNPGGTPLSREEAKRRVLASCN